MAYTFLFFYFFFLLVFKASVCADGSLKSESFVRCAFVVALWLPAALLTIQSSRDPRPLTSANKYIYLTSEGLPRSPPSISVTYSRFHRC